MSTDLFDASIEVVDYKKRREIERYRVERGGVCL